MNMEDYELANDTVRRYWSEFPVGRTSTTLILELSNLAAGYVTFKAEVFREADDPFPAATGYAHGNVNSYPIPMKKWFVEDTETSALARAIKTLSPSAQRPSREDMSRTDKAPAVDPWTKEVIEIAHGAVIGSGNAWETPSQAPAYNPPPPGTPTCQHGVMVRKEGTSKAGKEYAGWVCSSTDRDFQCPAKWDA